MLPRTLGAHLSDAGFELSGREVFTIFDPNGDERSYSMRQVEHLGANAIGVPDEEVESWAADLQDLARSGNYLFSLNRYIFLATKPTTGGA
jgi:arsenite methyltransferase